MSRRHLTLMAGAALALLALAAAAQPPQGSMSLAERLLAAERQPLQDPGAGRLYPQAAALLASARELPDQIELVHPAVPPEPEPAKAAPTPAPAAQPPAEKPWPQVVKGPVVDSATLAYTRFLAGDYAGAAALYAPLHEQKPDDLFVTQMLFLSARDAGDMKTAAPLLDELKARPETKEWADWVGSMLALGGDVKKEEEAK